MSKAENNNLGTTLWNIANELRGSMNAGNFQDYILAFIFLYYLSDKYQSVIESELGSDYPVSSNNDDQTPFQMWYANNAEDIEEFEEAIRLRLHYIIKPDYLWDGIVKMAKLQKEGVLDTLQKSFKYIEEESFDSTLQGLFSEINLNSDKLGKDYTQRNQKLCNILVKLDTGLSEHKNRGEDTLGNAYEELIGYFAANSGQKAGEFYTPQQVSAILSQIVLLDGQDPTSGNRKNLNKILDFACGSGSLLLNIHKHTEDKVHKIFTKIGTTYGQEKNITTYNLARMNMLLHNIRDNEFEIFHGDTLTNEWDFLNERNPAKKPEFDAIVANPPFSLSWSHYQSISEDMRFKNHGLAPKSAADFAFLLHGLHYLKKDGVMAIILPHGILFRGGAEQKIRKKLLEDGNIDTIIGLPSNLFYSTGIPVCIIVLKKCANKDDILFIDASSEGNFRKEKRQNHLDDEHIQKIVETYKHRQEINRYSCCVKMQEIKDNDYNLNISRYVDTSVQAEPIDLVKTQKEIDEINEKILQATKEHNKFLEELGLKPIV